MSEEENPIYYESALIELQDILQQLDQPNTKMDQLSILTKRAKFLIDFCKDRLRQIENQKIIE